MISVLVPSYRRPTALRECLRALVRQTTMPDEIIVVVRRGDTASEEVVRRCGHAAVQMVAVTEPGVLAAMRVGLLSCTGDVVAFIDDDAVAPTDWLARLMALMQDGVGAVGGKDRVAGAPGACTTDVGRITRWGRIIGNHHVGAGPVRDVDILKGVNMAVRRDAVALPVGLKGDGAQRHFEVAMMLHVRAVGWRVLYDPSIIVDHYPAVRHDSDARDQPDRAATRAAAYNLVNCLLSFRPELLTRRAIYGITLGDRAAPGLGRAIAALARGEADVLRAVLPSLRGQVEALWAIRRDRSVRAPSAPARTERGCRRGGAA